MGAEEQERQKKLEQERKDAEKLAQESKRISSSPDNKSPPSEENKTEVVVMRRSRLPCIPHQKTLFPNTIDIPWLKTKSKLMDIQDTLPIQPINNPNEKPYANPEC